MPNRSASSAIAVCVEVAALDRDPRQHRAEHARRRAVAGGRRLQHARERAVFDKLADARRSGHARRAPRRRACALSAAASAQSDGAVGCHRVAASPRRRLSRGVRLRGGGLRAVSAPASSPLGQRALHVAGRSSASRGWCQAPGSSEAAHGHEPRGVGDLRRRRGPSEVERRDGIRVPFERERVAVARSAMAEGFAGSARKAGQRARSPDRASSSCRGRRRSRSLSGVAKSPADLGAAKGRSLLELHRPVPPSPPRESRYLAAAIGDDHIAERREDGGLRLAPAEQAAARRPRSRCFGRAAPGVSRSPRTAPTRTISTAVRETIAMR